MFLLGSLADLAITIGEAGIVVAVVVGLWLRSEDSKIKESQRRQRQQEEKRRIVKELDREAEQTRRRKMEEEKKRHRAQSLPGQWYGLANDLDQTRTPLRLPLFRSFMAIGRQLPPLPPKGANIIRTCVLDRRDHGFEDYHSRYMDSFRLKRDEEEIANFLAPFIARHAQRISSKY